MQYNKVGVNGKTDIANLCDKIMDSNVDGPYLQLASIIKKSKCTDWSYKTFLKNYQNTTWDSGTSQSISKFI